MYFVTLFVVKAISIALICEQYIEGNVQLHKDDELTISHIVALYPRKSGLYLLCAALTYTHIDINVNTLILGETPHRIA